MNYEFYKDYEETKERLSLLERILNSMLESENDNEEEKETNEEKEPIEKEKPSFENREDPLGGN